MIRKSRSLEKERPDLAKEWHPTKNHGLTPRDVTAFTAKHVWWKCDKGHEWQAYLSNRSRGDPCPYCSGKRPCKDYCLLSSAPHLAAEWHPSKNGDLTPEDVTPFSGKTVWWRCRKGHEWKAKVSYRRRVSGCPYCGTKRKKLRSGKLTSTYEERVKLIDAWNKKTRKRQKVTAEILLESAGFSSEPGRLYNVALKYLTRFDMESVAEKISVHTYRKLANTGIVPVKRKSEQEEPEKTRASG